MERVIFPNGIPEPEGLKSYEESGGYQALRKSISQLSPEAILNEVIKSGLRGRGGAGFPTGKKWSITCQAKARPKYVVCNGGEDEPGSIKDKLLLLTRPHLVLEGVIIGSICVGATTAYMYVNVTYPDVIETLGQTIAEAKQAGYLGNRILGSKFKLDIKMTPAPINYVAGEDTAALEVLEGKAPLPRQKPPYPATNGLFGKPTLVNNVETLANIPPIIAHGAEWYRQMGTPDSPGTMIFSLGNEVSKPGAYELPFGTSLRYLLYECGGGLKGDKKLKAILPGGPSTAFLPATCLDVRLDPTSLTEAGSSLGCGVMRFLDADSCMVEEVVQIARFFAQECCGQCPACRMETGALVALLDKLQTGQGGDAILGQFASVIDFNKGKGFCSLINMPGPPILSALRLFPEDFKYHLQNGECPRK